ncbi:hypothetical protein GCM10011571_34260 [Marinithermofilum abyssi]|uniref:Uncharacterized protein n=1 Tax=Marinithermofilum abyssi TaxID=1571185 RepID=A0A8J2VMT4_9BACL|nr:hypothetical protein GCM10011571_34260 [Marinithermofilum abyssi]
MKETAHVEHRSHYLRYVLSVHQQEVFFIPQVLQSLFGLGISIHEKTVLNWKYLGEKAVRRHKIRSLIHAKGIR